MPTSASCAGSPCAPPGTTGRSSWSGRGHPPTTRRPPSRSASWSKGAAGGWVAFQVDDVDAAHAELVEKGVEITQPPTDQPYGRDMGLRDPFGNNLRIGNVTV